jgi:hypothetical protein
MQTYNHVIVPAVGDNLRHFDCSICLCDLGNAGEWKEQFVQQLFVNVPLTAASLSTVPEGSGVGLSFLHFSCHVELCRDVASPPKSGRLMAGDFHELSHCDFFIIPFVIFHPFAYFGFELAFGLLYFAKTIPVHTLYCRLEFQAVISFCRFPQTTSVGRKQIPESNRERAVARTPLTTDIVIDLQYNNIELFTRRRETQEFLFSNHKIRAFVVHTSQKTSIQSLETFALVTSWICHILAVDSCESVYIYSKRFAQAILLRFTNTSAPSKVIIYHL